MGGSLLRSPIIVVCLLLFIFILLVEPVFVRGGDDEYVALDLDEYYNQHEERGFSEDPNYCPPLASHAKCDGEHCTYLPNNPEHCGSCYNQCGGGTPYCNGFSCSQCPPGQEIYYGYCRNPPPSDPCPGSQKDCDGDGSCETDTTSTFTSCGSCSHSCASTVYANAGTLCASSACRMGACNPGWCDVDGSTSNGCEFYIGTEGGASCPSTSSLSETVTTSNAAVFATTGATSTALNSATTSALHSATSSALYSTTTSALDSATTSALDSATTSAIAATTSAIAATTDAHSASTAYMAATTAGNVLATTAQHSTTLAALNVATSTASQLAATTSAAYNSATTSALRSATTTAARNVVTSTSAALHSATTLSSSTTTAAAAAAAGRSTSTTSTSLPPTSTTTTTGSSSPPSINAPMVVQVIGGDRVVDAASVVRVDASLSYDPSSPTPSSTNPLIFTWVCEGGCSSANIATGAVLSNLAILQFQPNTLRAGSVIRIRIMVSNSAKSGSQVVFLSVVNGDVPNILIQPVGPYNVISAARDTIIKGYSSSNNYRWSISSLTHTIVNITNVALRSTVTSSELLILAGKLQEGTVYTLSLESVSSTSSLVGRASVTIRVGVPPSGGDVGVNPNTGAPMSTLFRIVISNWVTHMIDMKRAAAQYDPTALIYTMYHLFSDLYGNALSSPRLLGSISSTTFNVLFPSCPSSICFGAAYNSSSSSSSSYNSYILVTATDIFGSTSSVVWSPSITFSSTGTLPTLQQVLNLLRNSTTEEILASLSGYVILNPSATDANAILDLLNTITSSSSSGGSISMNTITMNAQIISALIKSGALTTRDDRTLQAVIDNIIGGSSGISLNNKVITDLSNVLNGASSLLPPLIIANLTHILISSIITQSPCGVPVFLNGTIAQAAGLQICPETTGDITLIIRPGVSINVPSNGGNSSSSFSVVVTGDTAVIAFISGIAAGQRYNVTLNIPFGTDPSSLMCDASQDGQSWQGDRVCVVASVTASSITCTCTGSTQVRASPNTYGVGNLFSGGDDAAKNQAGIVAGTVVAAIVVVAGALAAVFITKYRTKRRSFHHQNSFLADRSSSSSTSSSPSSSPSSSSGAVVSSNDVELEEASASTSPAGAAAAAAPVSPVVPKVAVPYDARYSNPIYEKATTSPLYDGGSTEVNHQPSSTPSSSSS
eukprot:TRINITY_DN3000_c0_g1_i1.p1 TRINITY_DN3000_c0_g1~~TRINITY_DN3000_c0_g1_i1.p1  ORF type:complete len:1180 (+),score=213.75 TRINITY_DN3000_c0_g1_i1:75-3614(+)